MRRPARTLIATAVIAVAAALGVTAVAAPAAAEDTIAQVGQLDSVSVQYSESSYSSPGTLPYLHFLGWAADLNHPNRNGLTGQNTWDNRVWIRVSWSLPDGRVIDNGMLVGDTSFAVYRPDVHAAYPSVGAYQGFDFQMQPPTTGPMTVCLKLYEIDSQSVGPFGCRSVTVPSAPPAYHPTITPGWSAAPAAGTTLNIAVQGPSGGQDSVVWYRSPARDSDASHVSAIPGARTLSLPTDVGYSNRYVNAIITTAMPDGTVISITLDPVMLRYPGPGVPVDQVASDDRYSTSVATSQRAFPDPSVNVPVAYIASGATFPDALSAGAAAVHRKGTLLLTPPDHLDSRVAAELVRLHPASIVVAGGPATVSDAVLAQLSALAFAPQVTRVSGADRFEVSRNIIDDAFGTSVPDLYLTTGNGFADALTAGVAGAALDRPVLLTNGSAPAMDQATQDALARWGTTHVTIVGGTASVTVGVANGIDSSATVDRISGNDRYDVAAGLSRTFPPSDRVYLASGAGFADALTTAVLAGSAHAPLLLSAGQCSTTSTMSTLIARNPTVVVAVGGSASQDPEAWQYPCGP
jgi:putative cell wall-binding protein